MKLKKLLISCLLFSAISGTSTFALENNGLQSLSSDESVSITVKEYDAIRKLDKKTDSKLRSMGYTVEEIESIRNYEQNFADSIEELKNMDEKVLKENFDYTDEQIEIINNFDGTEEQMSRASASVTLTISKNSSSVSSSSSKLNVKVRFVWSGMPVCQFNDAFAMVNGEKMYYDNLNTLFTCTYVSGSGAQKTYQYYLKRTEAGNTGADVKFPFYKTVGTKYYLKSGSANVPLSRSSKVTQCGIGVSYGHANISLSSISVSYPSGLSVSFSGNVTKTSTSKTFTL
ncbi:MAG: hypothetical protein ACLR4X_11445 [Clostridia bacterium]